MGENESDALAFDEFGVAVVQAGQTKRFNQPFGFTGYQRDEVSGLYYAQARYFSAENARFISEDYVRDGVNWYVHCRGNPLRFVDLDGLAPGDPFDSLNDAAKDFGKTTNPTSIKENREYATYFYSWDDRRGRKYSYTEPHTDGLSDMVDVVTKNPPIPTGTKWEGAGHTHGAWGKGRVNDNFSLYDINKANQFDPNVPLIVVLPSGEIKIYYPPAHPASPNAIETISGKWVLPHDANHPDLPWLHAWLWGCENCFVIEGDC